MNREQMVEYVAGKLFSYSGDCAEPEFIDDVIRTLNVSAYDAEQIIDEALANEGRE